MAEPYSIQHVRFQDIAANSYVIALQQGVQAIMPEARWWIADEAFDRFPFPGEEGPVYCEDAGEEPSCKKSLEEQAKRQSSIVICSHNRLQGFVRFQYRDEFLGGLGVCNLDPKQRPLLEKILTMVEGYFALLSGALEDHDDLELVHSILGETITLVELDRLLQRQSDALSQALGASRSVILLINEDGEFYPAHIKNYPSGLLKRRDLEVTRYDYVTPHGGEESSLRLLEPDDPLRTWLRRALEELHHKVDEDADCWAISFYRNTYLIGMFLTFDPTPRSMSIVKQNLIRLLATGGAAALDYALTLERMKKRHKALSTIHIVHRLISSSFATNEILPKIGQLTLQLLQAQRCSIMLCDEDREVLLPKVSLGLDENEVGSKKTRIGEGLTGWVAENFNPVIFHPACDTPPWPDTGETYPAESYLSVALFDTDIEGVVTVAGKKGDFNPGDREILVTFAEQAVLAIKNARTHEGERIFTIKALTSIANLIETHDPGTPGVTAATCRWAQRIARFLQLGESDIQNIVYAALLNESGMLRTFGSPTPYEEHRQKGPQLSLRMTESLGLPDDAGRIVYHVNELWNGEGYPDKLKGREIPLGSRIIAIAYAFSALLNRNGRTMEGGRECLLRAHRTLSRFNERSYDPEIVEQLKEIIESMTDLEIEEEITPKS